jgi:hypothetical protein
MTDTAAAPAAQTGPTADADLLALVSAQRLARDTAEIAKFVRLAGTPDEAASFDYIEGELRAAGLEVARHSCHTFISLPKRATLEVTAPESAELTAITHSMGISTGPEGIEAEVVYVGAGQKGDFESASVAGKIALIDGMCGPGAVARAEANGCFAQVFINDDHLHQGIVSRIYGSPNEQSASELPRSAVASVVGADGERIRALLASGPVRLRLVTEVEAGWTDIPLVTADVRPEGDDDGSYVFFGSHVDSWDYGAIDNGAGNACLLEVARCMAAVRSQIKRGARFLFWSGHSHGRYAGSCWYVDNFWQDIYDHAVTGMAIDSPGSVGASNASLGGAKVMDELVDVAVRATEAAAGASGARPSRPGGGEQPLWRVGVPSLNPARLRQTPGSDYSLRFSPTSSWWHHTVEDTIDKLDPEVLKVDTQIYVLALWHMIRPEVLPFDYAAVGQAVIDHLRALPDSIDFTAAITAAEEFRNAVPTLGGAAPVAANNALRLIGRHLIPVLYTIQGQFEPDPIDDMGFLPGLRGAYRLPGLPGDSMEAAAIRVGLLRQRNRLVFALGQAAAEIARARG